MLLFASYDAGKRSPWRSKYPFALTLPSLTFLSTVACLGLGAIHASAQTIPTLPSARKVSVLTQRGDNARTGANLLEVTLNPKTVDAKSNLFGKLFSVAVEGNVFSQPLYAADVSFKSGPRRDVLYVATEKNNVYAIDANSGQQIWARNLGPSMPAEDIAASGRRDLQMGDRWDYKDLYPDIGITSTPVIDIKSGTIFVVANTKEGKIATPEYHHRLHAIDMRMGMEIQKPVEIQGSVAGTAVDAKDHKIVFNPFLQLNRPGLLLVSGIVYVAFGSHGEAGPFHGWIFGYNSSDISQPPVIFCTTPNLAGEPLPVKDLSEIVEWNRGGIWQSGTGLAADDQGAIYLATGDGAWDGKRNFSDSFLKLNNRLEILDWFTPWNHEVLDQHDIDLGSGGPVLLPGNLLVGGGKEGKLFVIKRDHLGHTSPTEQAQGAEIVQQIQLTKLPLDPAHAEGNSFHHLHGPPVSWPASDGLHVYVSPEMESLRAFKVLNGKLVLIGESQTTAPMAMPGMQTSMPGGILVLSSDGDKSGSAIVWSSIPVKDNANRQNVPGVLRAFDASDVSKELWNSEMNPDDKLGNFAKFCPPTVVNGRVYVATFAAETGYPAAVQTGPAHIVVYGLFGHSGRTPPVEYRTFVRSVE
jgi:outer membrane protein assembly factor BamB